MESGLISHARLIKKAVAVGTPLNPKNKQTGLEPTPCVVIDLHIAIS